MTMASFVSSLGRVQNPICRQQYRSFYGIESRFAIHDDPGAGLRSTMHDPKIVTKLFHVTMQK